MQTDRLCFSSFYSLPDIIEHQSRLEPPKFEMNKYFSYQEKFEECFQIAVDLSALKRLKSCDENSVCIDEIWLDSK